MFSFLRACQIIYSSVAKPRGGRCIETESSLCQMNYCKHRHAVTERSGGLPTGWWESPGTNIGEAHQGTNDHTVQFNSHTEDRQGRRCLRVTVGAEVCASRSAASDPERTFTYRARLARLFHSAVIASYRASFLPSRSLHEK